MTRKEGWKGRRKITKVSSIITKDYLINRNKRTWDIWEFYNGEEESMQIINNRSTTSPSPTLKMMRTFSE